MAAQQSEEPIAFSLIIDGTKSKITAFPEANKWPLDDDTFKKLTDFMMKNLLQTFATDKPPPERPPSSAAEAHTQLTQSHSMRYFLLPGLDRGCVYMSFLVLFYSVDESIVQGKVADLNRRQNYAVVVGIQWRMLPRVESWTLLPTLRDWVAKAYYEIMWKYVLYDDMEQAQKKVADCPNPLPEDWLFDDFTKEWKKKLSVLHRNIELWIDSQVEYGSLTMESSLFYSKFVEAMTPQPPPPPKDKIALRQSLTVKPSRDSLSNQQDFWEKLNQVLTAVLVHHTVILRGSKAEDVTQWLKTVSFFLPDDKFLRMRVVCTDNVIPDLHFQGTTAKLKQIALNFHLFRLPPVVIDIDQPLEEKFHLFPKDTLTYFEEKRMEVFCAGYQKQSTGMSFVDSCMAAAQSYLTVLTKAKAHLENRNPIPVFTNEKFKPLDSARSKSVDAVLSQLRRIFDAAIRRFDDSRRPPTHNPLSLRDPNNNLVNGSMISRYSDMNSLLSHSMATIVPDAGAIAPPAPTDSPPSLRRHDTQQEEITAGFHTDVTLSWFPAQSLRAAIQRWRRSVQMRALEVAIEHLPKPILEERDPVDRKIYHVFVNFAVPIAAQNEEQTCIRLVESTYF